MTYLISTLVQIAQVKNILLRKISVGCAFYSVKDYSIIYDFCCSVADILHLLPPQYYIFYFEFFGKIFFIGK